MLVRRMWLCFVCSKQPIDNTPYIHNYPYVVSLCTEYNIHTYHRTIKGKVGVKIYKRISIYLTCEIDNRIRSALHLSALTKSGQSRWLAGKQARRVGRRSLTSRSWQ